MSHVRVHSSNSNRGGHTNFRNAGVHVKPQVGDAIFFSYIDPEKMVMDSGFTEHSGCPVYEGDKKIVTQWIRYGVDDENPWDSFNTLGIKISDVMKLESGEDIDETDDGVSDEDGDLTDDALGDLPGILEEASASFVDDESL